MNVINVEMYSLLVLIIITIDYYLKYKTQKDVDSKYFYLLVVFIGATSIINILISIFSSTPSISYLLLFLGYIFIILPPLVLYAYTRKKYFFTAYKAKKVRIVLSAYYLLYFAMLIHIFVHNFNIHILPHHITEMEQYSIILLFALLPLVFLLFLYFYNLIAKRKETFKVLIFICIPILGICVDLITNTFTFVSIGYTLGALMLYISKYDMTLNIDSLTQTYNRRYFDAMLNDIDNLNKRFAVLMIDIDDFKKVNDVYGHLTGDKVLKEVSDLLNSSVRRNDSVIRYGGDEFVVIGQIKGKNDLALIENKIQSNIKKHNKTANIKISLSIGKGIFDSKTEELREFFDKIDQDMYEQKKQKK